MRWHGIGLCLAMLAQPLAAQTHLLVESAGQGALSGNGQVTETVLAPPGHILTGIVMPERGAPPCSLELAHRALGAQSGGGTIRFDACASPGTVLLSKRVDAPKGSVVTSARLCHPREVARMEGLALSARPDFCAADPALWIERETGLPFRLRVRTDDGFLRPPWSYARPCSSDVALQTVSDARPGCKRWQARSDCPEGFVATGLGLALHKGAQGERVITGLHLRCTRIATDH